MIGTMVAPHVPSPLDNVRLVPVPRPTRLHPCSTPVEGRRGDEWECECRARWLCVNHLTLRPRRPVQQRADWIRSGFGGAVPLSVAAARMVGWL